MTWLAEWLWKIGVLPGSTFRQSVSVRSVFGEAAEVLDGLCDVVLSAARKAARACAWLVSCARDGEDLPPSSSSLAGRLFMVQVTFCLAKTTIARLQLGCKCRKKIARAVVLHHFLALDIYRDFP